MDFGLKCSAYMNKERDTLNIFQKTYSKWRFLSNENSSTFDTISYWRSI